MHNGGMLNKSKELNNMEKQTIQQLIIDLLHRERINSIGKELTDSQILKNIIKCEETAINFAISEIKNITKPLKEEFGKEV